MAHNSPQPDEDPAAATSGTVNDIAVYKFAAQLAVAPSAIGARIVVEQAGSGAAHERAVDASTTCSRAVPDDTVGDHAGCAICRRPFCRAPILHGEGMHKRVCVLNEETPNRVLTVHENRLAGTVAANRDSPRNADLRRQEVCPVGDDDRVSVKGGLHGGLYAGRGCLPRGKRPHVRTRE